MKNTVIVSIALLATLGLHGNAEALTEISYNDFTSNSGYTLLGSAQQSGNSLQLVRYMDYNKVGGVFFNTPVNISSFSASYSFTFSNPGGGDGIVFVIKNPDSKGIYTDGLGYTGEAIGYGDRYGVSGIRNSVAVELDNHKNNTTGVTNDINDNHIGIDTNASMLSLAQVAVSPDFNSANPWYAWVDYDGTTLSVSVNQTGTKPATAMLSYGTSETPFVISNYVGLSPALVGFTASTGGASQTTTLRSFSFDSTPVPEPSTLALLGTGAVFAGITSRRKARKTTAAG
jgi:hypothetical protein